MDHNLAEEDEFAAPDPVDSLLAMKDADKGRAERPMDFVRARFKKLKEENKDLRNQVADLKHTLAIVQTAQQWSQGNLMSQEQAQKVKEMTMLLQQAKAARDDAANFSKVGKAAMYEKVRQYKTALKKEREEKREMKERLNNAFEHARVIKEENKKLADKQKREREGWQEFVRDMKERHRKEMSKMQGDLEGQDEKRDERQKQLSHFGERVMQELSSLQQHLQEVRQETVDNVVLEGDEEFEERILGGKGGLRASWSEDEANLSPSDDDARGGASSGFFITQNS
jgi:chromosome segregation ATPase